MGRITFNQPNVNQSKHQTHIWKVEAALLLGGSGTNGRQLFSPSLWLTQSKRMTELGDAELARTIKGINLDTDERDYDRSPIS